MTQLPTPNKNTSFAFLGGAGVFGTQLAEHDWSASSLGHPSTWPNTLRTIVRLMLDSRFPMFIAWGEELGCLYNEAYKEFLGSSHPHALGRPLQEILHQIWPEISPLVELALAGKASYFEDFPLTIERNGRAEQLWFTFFYSPVHNDEDQVMGIHAVLTETTARVLAEKRRAFQLLMSDTFRVLSGPLQIMEAASRLTGEYLGAERVGYGEIDQDEKIVRIDWDWTNGSINSLARQTFRLDDSGPDLINELRKGRILRLDDINTDARCAPYARSYANLGAHAMVVVPLLESGHLPRKREANGAVSLNTRREILPEICSVKSQGKPMGRDGP